MNRKIIESGTFFVGKKQPLVLEAYLGTCVGLSIVDRKNKVGGLYHILLPESLTPTESDFQPCVYATTGLPIFLEELIKIGASKSNMRASIAGGALTAPLTEEDFVFNIGGQNLEVVEDFLRTEKIPIEASETGGFFTCTMSLNLETLETSVEPFGVDSTIDIKHIRRPTESDILHTTTNIKPIPQVALRILNMLQAGDYNFSEVAGEIKKDQVITAKIISFCQSPVFATRHPITSIDRAIVYLGERRLLKTVLEAYCETIYSVKTGGYSMCRGGLFNHAVTTAHLSEALASSLNLPEDQAYTAGLLHDIGKVVLDHYIHPVAPYFYRQVLVSGKPLVEVEEQVFGFTHTEVGKILAETWFFPSELVDVIYNHETACSAPNNMEPITYVVALANIIAGRFMVGRTLSGTAITDFQILKQIQSLGRKELFSIIEKASQISAHLNHEEVGS
ncbi:MAG: HDOD domain-containing protein [Deltaproteobacteria bacterium]|nr:HDOD domain-containing protein [Deltaproteobacteria bacterium]MBW2067701.1 HDOD domain-containing protein [Deltaproteobacteria bacterium]